MKIPNKTNIQYIAIIICISLIGGFLTCMNYSIDKKHILGNTNRLFNKAIHLDKDIRENETPFFGISIPIAKDSTPSGLTQKVWNKHASHVITRTNDNTILTQKTEDSGSITKNEKKYLCEQMYLVKKNPIDPARLDSIFAEELHQNHILAQTAVIYECDGIKHYSNADSSFYASAYKLDDIVLELDHKIRLQGYIKLPFTHIIQQSRSLYFLTILIWLLLTGGATWLLLKKKKEEVPAIIIPKGYIAISEKLLFNEKEGILKYLDRKDVVLSGYKLKLFISLLNENGHFIPIETIKDIVWADGMSTKNALIQTVKRLREDLRFIPDLKIENSREKGYRLQIKNKTKKDARK